MDGLDLLAHDLDALEKEYKAKQLKVESLKSMLDVEVETRRAAEALSASLQQDKCRLLKFQEECLARTVQQLDYKIKYESLWQEVRLRQEQDHSKQKEHEQAFASLQAKLETREHELDERIRYLENQLGLKDLSVVQLEQEIAQLHERMDIAHQSFEEIRKDERGRGRAEVEKLKLELSNLEEMNRSLQDQLHKQEKSWVLEKTRLEAQLQELSSNWHVGVLKQKLMKLRKENEDLKQRQLWR